MSDVKLSICCITFNHAKFIRQTLDGFVMQKTNFPFEVLIHDDASTDGTADIIREYEAKFPDIIKPICQTENQWSKGVSISKTFNFPRVQGEYVAMCEGDDYWTDPLKLQKQADFLDAHPDYTICFHPVRILWEKQPEREEIFPTPEMRGGRTVFAVEDLIQKNIIQTNSVLYRWVFPEKEPLDVFPAGILPGDAFLHLIHAKHGKIGFIDEVMAVYRRHEGGVWQGLHSLKYGAMEDHFFECADALLDHRFHAEFDRKEQEFLTLFLMTAIQHDDFKEFTRVGKLPREKVDLVLQRAMVPQGKWSWKHRLVNRLAKLLGLGVVYYNSGWFWGEK
ncbi:MAG: glycosyltransferase [Thermoguttaceae bacterium]|nr:glycosyltransferase [Thermoguttaceae bacterium]